MWAHGKGVEMEAWREEEAGPGKHWMAGGGTGLETVHSRVNIPNEPHDLRLWVKGKTGYPQSHHQDTGDAKTTLGVFQMFKKLYGDC